MTRPREGLNEPTSERTSDGFTLLEVLMAMVLIAILATGVVDLFTSAAKATASARAQTSMALLAVQRMEDLRSRHALSPSPPAALASNVAGFADFLDCAGRVVGAGTSAPPGACFVRRWSVEPLAASPTACLVLQVLVLSTASSPVIARLASVVPWKS
jgi:prepilin-type N-terminal cleavage/methylation domain-containing protein